MLHTAVFTQKSAIIFSMEENILLSFVWLSYIMFQFPVESYDSPSMKTFLSQKAFKKSETNQIS